MLFRINGNCWQLYLVPPKFHKLFRDDGTISIGVTDSDEKAVYVNERLPNDLMFKVIAHELTHVAIFEYGIVVDRKTEEMIADFIASHGIEILDTADGLIQNTLEKRA